MKGLDTNVLVRFLTADDPAQSEAARQLVASAEAGGERLHVSTVVLAELVWVLRSRRYAVPRDRIADGLDALLEATVFEVQDRDLVRRAVQAFRSGPADFSDYLAGEQDRRAGCSSTVTFDRRLATADGFELLEREPDPPSHVSEP